MTIIFLLFLVNLAVSVFALTEGPVNISPSRILKILAGVSVNDAASRIVTEIRLPRIVLAIGVGGGLSVAGAAFQAVLLNPLAEPYILGVSSGGAFGAVLSMLFALPFLGVELFSFAGALLVVFVVFLFSKRFGDVGPNVLLLTGVMAGAFFSALILLILTFLKNSLRTAVFWLMGNLSMANREEIYFVFFLSVVISIFISLNGNNLNILSLGNEQAFSLGLNAAKVKNFIYFSASIMVGAIVSVSGIIGFVGLLAPHICRMIWGNDNRLVVPASFFVGAIILVISDLISRSIAPPAEIPVGAVTALLGAPFFVYLLRKKMQF